jgi:hypothetical protein
MAVHAAEGRRSESAASKQTAARLFVEQECAVWLLTTDGAGSCRRGAFLRIVAAAGDLPSGGSPHWTS